MMGLPERAVDSEPSAGNSDDSTEKDPISADSEQKSTNTNSSKASLFASLLASTLGIFETRVESSSSNMANKTTSYGLSTAVTNVMSSGPMRRLQESILGTTRTEVLSSTSEIWLLGKCYNISREESSSVANPGNSYAEFLEDFSSRIWITYRKGFDPIGDTNFTSDVSWGCMIRSSQMLVAQALLFHCLGRSWRKPSQKPYDPEYIEILHHFGDSEACAFSIHNLLQAGRHYGLAAGSWLGLYAMCRTWETLTSANREKAGLAAGSWLGPYAMCRTWETLTSANREKADLHEGKKSFPMVLHIVSGDGDGELGGAPVVCIDVAERVCSSFSKGQLTWAPILLLVPLVLGLEKINPRYIPLLRETFTFPQSLGIVGGIPGASTYIVGVQEDKALYLDPHEVQPAVDIKSDNLEVDCPSYHCRTIRHMQLDLIDPSLAIGFYCRDKDDFEDFCYRASQLGEKSNGAPLFTITQFRQPTKPALHNDALADGRVGSGNFVIDDIFDSGLHPGEDDWQLL